MTVLLDVSLNVGPLLSHQKGPIRETVPTATRWHMHSRGLEIVQIPKSRLDGTTSQFTLREPGQDDHKEGITMEAKVLPWHENAMFLNCGTGVL